MADQVDAASLISRLSAPQLGPDPSAPPPGAGLPPQSAQPTEKQAPAAMGPTPTEAAVSAGSPKDEGDAMSADAIMYKLGDKSYSPQQLQGTMDRYRDLNFKQQENANLMRVAEIAMKSGRAKSPDDVAMMLVNMLKAETPNAQMGGQDERPNTQSAPPEDDELSKWEEENAAKLPPGYRELQKGLGSLGGGMGELKQMLMQVLQASQGQAAQGADALSQAKEQRGQAIQGRIANNLETLANKLGLGEQHSGDFMIFAGERGYTLDDFIDPKLAASVMQDFKQNMDAPEMERLRGIHQRRQAFTGTMAASPGAASGTPAPSEGGDPDLARLGQRVMDGRNG